MGNIKGQHQFPEQVYLWEETDPVQGGDEGIDNVPIKQLANRTQYLGDLSLKLFKDVFDKEPLGSFGLGFTLSSPDQVVYDESSETWYKWIGNVPKVVSPGKTPANSGGIYDAVTNPTGLWFKLDINRSYLSPGMFGAVGGSADNYQPLVKMFAKSKETGLPVLIDKVYKCSGKLSVDASIKISGYSPETCKIIFTDSLSYGLYITQNSSKDFIDLSGFSLSAGAAITSKDALLVIDATSQLTSQTSAGKKLLADRTIRRARLHNLNLDCEDGCYAVNYINLKSLMNYSVSNILIRGSRSNLSKLTNGILLTGDGFPVDIHMSDLLMYNLGRGINSVDYVEGLHISEFEFVNVLRGISAEYDSNYSTLSESLCGFYGPFIHDGHVNLGTMAGADSCIYMKNVTTPRVKNLLLFASAGADVDVGYGVYAYAVSGGEISSVYVAGSGAANTKTVNRGVSVYGGSNLILSENQSTNMLCTIYLEGTSKNCIVKGNQGISNINTVYVYSSNNTSNRIMSDNFGTSLTGSVVGGDPSACFVEALTWSRSYTLNLAAAKTAGSSFSFSIPMSTSYFGVAPDSLMVSLPGSLIGQVSYNKSSSTSTSINVTLYFLTDTPAGSYELSLVASCYGVNRTQ